MSDVIRTLCATDLEGDMDFWTSTASAVVGGILTFLLTTVPWGLAHRTSAHAADPTAAPPPTRSGDGNSIDIDVAGDIGGNLTAKINDNRKIRKTKITNIGPTVKPSPPSKTNGSDDTSETVGLLLGYALAAIAVAVVFLFLYPYLLVLTSCVLGLTIGILVNLTVRSLRVEGAWTPLVSVMLARAAIATTVFVASWGVIRATTRGRLNLESMGQTLSSDGAGSTTGNAVSDFFAAAMARATAFFTTYEWKGTLFVLLMIASVAIATMLVVSLLRDSRVWSRFLAYRAGEQLPKKVRKQARAFGERRLRSQALSLVGSVVAGAIAVSLGSGLGFDGASLLQNQSQLPLPAPTAPAGE